jgi:acyl-[acyl-carrier-protein]-phospholipid O-acyltransferase/long-chain-fatty-acid--[acyl-carrier-protein] ligase
MRMAGCIPISEKGAKDAILQAADALKEGEIVCIFPEGSITRIGFLLPFKRGIELILKKAPGDTVVIPVYFDKLWGSIFSFKGGKFFRKIPERLPYPVTVLFGKPMAKGATAFDLRQRVSELGSKAFSMRESEIKTLPALFINTARKFLFRKSAVDIMGKPVTWLKFLTSSILLSRQIRKICRKDEMVGLMLPASVAGAISNAAASISGKTAVNLNFKAGDNATSKAIAKCEIKTIITSKRFVEKAGLNELKQFVYLEDIAKNINPVAKVGVLASVILLPAYFLTALYCKRGVRRDDTAAVIFSSGSTGDPKGVMLSHANIISNLEMVNQVLHISPHDRMLGSLPFFHSFGYTVTFWLPLLKGMFTIYIPNPLDAKKVGEMAEKYGATIMLGTPTFYSLYTRECKKEQLSRIRLAVAGAERLHPNVAERFREKFGLSIIEGYGVTEMSPAISCNVPDYNNNGIVQKGTKAGSVGVALPGISARIVEHDNFDVELSCGDEGMLLVKGPNRMAGYLKDEGLTKDVLHKGWYITGDIAKIDDEGFIYIVGRLSRFSKIGGEMVPHIQVEEMIHKALGFEERLLVVTAVESGLKGEKLVVLHLPEASAHVDTKKISEKLRAAGLPNLWIPRDFYEVDEFPMLASGKLNLKAISAMAHSSVTAKKSKYQN